MPSLNRTASGPWHKTFNESYDVGIYIEFLRSCPKGFISYHVKGLLKIYEDIEEILLMLHVFLSEDQENEYLIYGSPYRSETSVLFCNLFSFWLDSVYDGLQHDLTRMAVTADGSVVLTTLFTFLWECNN